MNLFKSVTGRYVAPEVYKNEEYDTKVDVFSFALILQEVKSLLLIFGCMLIFLILVLFNDFQINDLPLLCEWLYLLWS